MPYYAMREFWTPLAIFGVKFYKDSDTNTVFMKVGNKRRRRIFK